MSRDKLGEEALTAEVFNQYRDVCPFLGSMSLKDYNLLAELDAIGRGVMAEEAAAKPTETNKAASGSEITKVDKLPRSSETGRTTEPAPKTRDTERPMPSEVAISLAEQSPAPAKVEIASDITARPIAENLPIIDQSLEKIIEETPKPERLTAEEPTTIEATIPRAPAENLPLADRELQQTIEHARELPRLANEKPIIIDESVAQAAARETLIAMPIAQPTTKEIPAPQPLAEALLAIEPMLTQQSAETTLPTEGAAELAISAEDTGEVAMIDLLEPTIEYVPLETTSWGLDEITTEAAARTLEISDAAPAEEAIVEPVELVTETAPLSVEPAELEEITAESVTPEPDNALAANELPRRVQMALPEALRKTVTEQTATMPLPITVEIDDRTLPLAVAIEELQELVAHDQPDTGVEEKIEELEQALIAWYDEVCEQPNQPVDSVERARFLRIIRQPDEVSPAAADEAKVADYTDGTRERRLDSVNSVQDFTQSLSDRLRWSLGTLSVRRHANLDIAKLAA